MIPPKAAVDALKKFGTTLDGKPIWRVIWSDEKISFGDGKEIQEYAHLPHRWILEKWCVNTIGPEEWEKTRDPETGEYIVGPYTNGSYELCYAFPEDAQLGSSIVETIPRLINAGIERFSFSQRMTAAKAAVAKREEDWRKRNSDIWDDSQDAFRGKVFSGAHGHRIRGPEDIKIILTDQDIPAALRASRGFRQI
jgi:hypothetical protein